MYDVSAQGVDERMINVHYYYYLVAVVVVVVVVVTLITLSASHGFYRYIAVTK